MKAAADSGYLLEVPENFFTLLGLPSDLHYTDDLEHVFPGVSNYFPHNTYLDIFIGIESEYDSFVEFRKNNVQGQLSPVLEFYDHGKLAFKFRFSALLDMDVTFDIEDKVSVMHGKLHDLNLNSYDYTAGIVEEIDLPWIIRHWNDWLIGPSRFFINKILDDGLYFRAINVFEQIFGLAIETIFLRLENNYAEASFTMDIHNTT